MLVLHEDWCALMNDPDAFWRQTPGSFATAMRGAMRRLKREGARDIALAHTTAAMVSVGGKLKPLDRYLPRDPVRSRAGSMLDRMKALADATKDLG